MKTIKLLIVITDSDFGGTEKVVFQLASRLHQESSPPRFKIKLVVLKSKGRMARELEALGIPVKCLGLGKSARIWYLLRLLPAMLRWFFLLREEKPDLVHGFLFQANFFARLSTLFVKTKNLSSLRVIEPRTWQKYIEKITGWMVDLYLAVSENVKDWAIKQMGIAPAKIQVIKNGIELKNLPTSDRDALRAELGVARDEIVFITIGRLDWQKGIDLFLSSGKKLMENYPQLKFLIVGDGPERSSLEQLSEKLGIKSRAIFLGARTDIFPLLNLSDIFVLASRWEGFPNVILEAMACQKPIIATKVGGVPEMVENEISALLVPPSDIQALTQAMERLLKDPELRSRLAFSARRKVEQEFKIEDMIKNYRRLYLELLGEKN